ncbi:MAG: sarcosine oxidase subunit delta [Rhizobiaceae bacterium]|nr:sarcosine oxidase subunit delta [Rhizobiaceae bacterium]
MLLIRCPWCEEDLPELEFRHAGEAHIARPTNLASIPDADFEKFFFIRSNPKGIVFERWRHVHGCARFFNAVRDTVSDRFVTTYKAGEARPVLPAVGDTGPAAHGNVEPKKLNVRKPAARGNGK